MDADGTYRAAELITLATSLALRVWLRVNSGIQQAVPLEQPSSGAIRLKGINRIATFAEIKMTQVGTNQALMNNEFWLEPGGVICELSIV